MKITKTWAMPNKNTFQIKPIKELVDKYLFGKSIDPFANSCNLAKITNDLDSSYKTDYNMEAIDFLKKIKSNTIDSVLFDPPYSPRQISECYKKLGKAVSIGTTQASYWKKLKVEISRIVKHNGIVISCGWNSGGIGKKYGFKQIEILLVAHGGAHNDTIVVVEKRLRNDLFEINLKGRIKNET